MTSRDTPAPQSRWLEAALVVSTLALLVQLWPEIWPWVDVRNWRWLSLLGIWLTNCLDPRRWSGWAWIVLNVAVLGLLFVVKLWQDRAAKRDQG